ncbi:hypothetical protein [Lysobacter sp. CA196]|uniref:hypothetical protein n=1 Tax=Lysobacter sp. CA196 TaxID=3455606 RepID=UPI003F8CF4CC
MVAAFAEQALLGKRSEVAALDYKDAYLAKVVMDIHRLRSGKAQAMVPLRALHPMHFSDNVVYALIQPVAVARCALRSGFPRAFATQHRVSPMLRGSID